MEMIINCSKEKTMQIFEREMRTTAVLTRNVKDQSGYREVPNGIVVFELWKYLRSNVSGEPLIDGAINDDNFRIYTLNLLPFVQNKRRRCQRWLLCGTIYEESGKTVLQAGMKFQFKPRDCIMAICFALMITILCCWGFTIVDLFEICWLFVCGDILSIILMGKCVKRMIIKDINHIFADFGTTVSKK